MTTLAIKPATRQSVRPLIGFYGESGTGKTYSSLLLARGLAGPSGEIVLVDSESGRGSLYADVLPGGYKVLDLGEPFSPKRYIEAITIAESHNPACIVIDSMSHEWEGIGGVLDAAGDNEQQSGKKGLHNWKTPKLEHAKLVQKLLRSKCPVVCCIRAKHKARQGKNEKGNTVIIKDDFTSPIQAEDFIFECTAHGEIMPDHSFRLTKCSHPGLKACLPNNAPVTVHHGELLAQWCAAPSTGKPTSAPTVATLKRQLWEMTKAYHKGSTDNLEAWLINSAILGETDKLANLSAEQLAGVIEQVQKITSDIPA